MVKSLQCLIPKNNIFTSLGNLYIISILYSYRYCLSTVYSYTLIIEILRVTTLTFILTCYTISRLNLFFIPTKLDVAVQQVFCEFLFHRFKSVLHNF